MPVPAKTLIAGNPRTDRLDPEGGIGRIGLPGNSTIRRRRCWWRQRRSGGKFAGSGLLITRITKAIGGLELREFLIAELSGRGFCREWRAQ
jgi:hypothetical protein